MNERKKMKDPEGRRHKQVKKIMETSKKDGNCRELSPTWGSNPQP